jgi:hypothetical protein
MFVYETNGDMAARVSPRKWGPDPATKAYFGHPGRIALGVGRFRRVSLFFFFSLLPLFRQCREVVAVIDKALHPVLCNGCTAPEGTPPP